MTTPALNKLVPISYRIELGIEITEQLIEANNLALKQITSKPFWVRLIKSFNFALIQWRVNKINFELEKFKLLFNIDRTGDTLAIIEILNEFNDFLSDYKGGLIEFYQTGHESVGGKDVEAGETIFNVYTYGGRI